MSWNSRRQICLVVRSDIEILIFIGMWHRRFRRKRSVNVHKIIPRTLISLSLARWLGFLFPWKRPGRMETDL